MQKEEILSLLQPALVNKHYLPADAIFSTPSAVLVIIHYHEDKPHIFLTRRSSNLKSHTGEISFPGGRYVESDGTLLASALRETAEEIGIVFANDQVVGCLRAVHTMTSSLFLIE